MIDCFLFSGGERGGYVSDVSGEKRARGNAPRKKKEMGETGSREVEANERERCRRRRQATRFDLPPLRPQRLLHLSDESPLELDYFDISLLQFTFFGSAGAGLAAGAPNPFFFPAATPTIDGRCRRRDTPREAPPCRSGQVSTAPARRISGELEDALQPAAVGGESALRELIALQTRGKVVKIDRVKKNKPSNVFVFFFSSSF